MRKNLKRLRQEHDLTQEQMAERVGVTRTSYNRIELGKSKGSMSFWEKVKQAFPEADIMELSKVKG